jgi:hypothetical protein
MAMLAFTAKIISRLRTYGLGYFAILARNEIAHPRYRATLQVRRALIGLNRLRRAGVQTHGQWSPKNLQFVYDLSVSPITFDFASYLAAAEVERRLRGFEGIDVILIPGPKDGVREETAEYEQTVDRDARQSRVRQMLLPTLSFLPTVRGVAVCADRTQAAVLLSDDPRRIYPSDYHLSLPRNPDKAVIHEHARSGVAIWPMFRATAQASKLVADFFAREVKGRRAVVITLRNYGYTPQRNSRNQDWLDFADSLDPAVYAVIFVHDAETFMGPAPLDFSRHIVCDAASANLEIRMALYEAAWLNMALMAGPTELGWYNERARYLYFIAVGSAAVQTEAALILNGHRVGHDLDFATPCQRIVWRLDETETLKREFRAMEALLTQHDGRQPACRDGRDHAQAGP